MENKFKSKRGGPGHPSFIHSRRKARKDDLHITIYQMMVLITNYTLAIEDDKIGHNDTESTIKDTLHRFKRHRINISVEELERFLYACNMMQEEKKFWHPNSESFDKFLYDVARKYKFNKIYNRLDLKEEEIEYEQVELTVSTIGEDDV